MGHAAHFLERLERLSLPHVELAMSLYRDVPLLLALLELARLPEGADRVALCLGESERGPYLVVTRAGGFVTCLAEGMGLNGLPVVSHRELQVIAGKLQVLRERLELARRLTGGRGDAMRIVRRIFTSGDALSREEVLGILAFQPMLEKLMLRWYTELGETAMRARPRYEQQLSRRDSERLSRQRRQAVLEYWNNSWAIGHLSVLVSPGVREVVEDFRSKYPGDPIPLSFHAGQHGIGAVALRGAYLTARIGKVVLPDCKRDYAEARFDLDYFAALLGLAALGVRHVGLRAEILKALPGKGLSFKEEPPKEVDEVIRTMPELVALTFRHPDSALKLQLERGRKLCVDWTRHLSPGSRWRFERPEDVPEDLARAATCHAARALSCSVGTLIDLIVDLAWAARAEPEALYLPADFLEAIHDEDASVRTAIGLLEHFRTVYGPREPERAPVQVSANERCSCGSGRKYKRCCGLRAAEEAAARSARLAVEDR